MREKKKRSTGRRERREKEVTEERSTGRSEGRVERSERKEGKKYRKK